MRKFPPERIICLTEETVETLYLLGEDKRIVGVSGYAVRPACVRQDKPRISAFTSANIPKILELEPDLVLSFSDMQADIVRELIAKGVSVMAYNQRDIAGILTMIRHLGAIVGADEKAEKLVTGYQKRLAGLTERTHKKPHPKVYFEEWDSPMITAIGWVSELIEIAGGRDCFMQLSHQKAAQDRLVTSKQIIEANPEIILASWCGKKVRPEKMAIRDGWDQIAAVKNNQIYEIKSPLILQPGPAALTDGLDRLIEVIQQK